MENYEPTLVETLNQLREEGYTEDFNIRNGNCLECESNLIQMNPEEFQVDKVFRFDGETNPADESALYAISSKKYGMKGVLVTAYGMYTETLTDELLRKLR